MNLLAKLKTLIVRRSKLEKVFGALALTYIALLIFAPGSGFRFVAALGTFFFAAWLLIRMLRAGIRTAIWRLRNRLLVTYLFIALVPVLLIVSLVGMCSYVLFGQVTVYLASSELERRVESLRSITATLADTEPAARPEVMRRVADIYHKRLPELFIVVRGDSSMERWPPGKPMQPPPPGWGEASGIVRHEGAYYIWSHIAGRATDITAAAPVPGSYLSEMIPGLGDVSLVDVSPGETRLRVKAPESKPAAHLKSSPDTDAGHLPPPLARFDIAVQWFSVTPVHLWNEPNGMTHTVLLLVHTRPSAVLNTIYNARVENQQQLLPFALLIVSILFLLVEIVSLVIGVSLTRTITNAVHNLYVGTQSVIAGDFSQRIAVHGKDQLAALSASFNSMTENLERLLAVAKEKERMQAEIEIAREVQSQLYPKDLPTLRTLRLRAMVRPARMVSGDYYDYQCMEGGQVALAIGDVAGKGISAALLMATVQATMRMELRATQEVATSGRYGASLTKVSTARVVSELNQQLYATTSPEKFATFYFAVYDEDSGELTYTNAGHLAPLLIRRDQVLRLDTNGTVVGAFPFSTYEESSIVLESGDLLVCYTDGITEPENEYGEMFGEDRLIEIVSKNAGQDEARIIASVMEAVLEWTGSSELQDDMTILLARRR